MNSKTRNTLLAALMLLTITGPGCLRVYRLDVQQGNAVTQEMADKLKAGMTRAQVRYALGTPLVTDPFHPNRWDYFYSYNKKDAEPETRRLTLLFQDDLLHSVHGDVVAKGAAAEPARPAPPAP